MVLLGEVINTGALQTNQFRLKSTGRKSKSKFGSFSDGVGVSGFQRLQTSVPPNFKVPPPDPRGRAPGGAPLSVSFKRGAGKNANSLVGLG